MLIISTNRTQQVLQIISTKPRIHIGNFGLQLRFISFRKATRNDHLAYLTFFLQRAVLEDGIDGFLLGVVDKTASVNDYNIVLAYLVGLVNNVELVAFELAHENF